MAVFLSDTFTDADNTYLTAHTPDVGGAWILRSGNPDGARIVGNRLDSTVYSAAIHTNAASPGGAEYDILWDCVVAGTAFSRLGAVARFLDLSNYYFFFFVSGSASVAYYIYRYLGGYLAVLAELVVGSPLSIGTHPAKVEIRNGSQKFYVDDMVTPKVSSADSSLTQAGVVGVYRYAQAGVLMTDNFVANDVSAPVTEYACKRPLRVWWPK